MLIATIKVIMLRVILLGIVYDECHISGIVQSVCYADSHI